MSIIRPRMYGSTDMNSLATRTSPGSRSSRTTVTVRKSDCFGHPTGRDTNWIWVLVAVMSPLSSVWVRSQGTFWFSAYSGLFIAL
ncbi:Uncharacterised protein [Mycobacteroides abscessus subsp. abscessus]|nr:Uncharacterised protein [Mycobacteroides abscessus subsp. abscessus]